MRVQGNAMPNAVRVEPCAPRAGYAEVRLCEHARAISGTMYEYDEYTMIVPEHSGLQAEIQANLAEWLATGRTLEVNPMATAVQDMTGALQTLGVQIETEDIQVQAQGVHAGIQALAMAAPDAVLLTTTQALYEAWTPSVHYDYNQPLTHEGRLYRVALPGGVDALAHQPPGGEGMLAVYRPIDETHAGTQDDPIPWVYGMDCHAERYYSHKGATYLCNADMIPCVWEPGEGSQWTKITTTDDRVRRNSYVLENGDRAQRSRGGGTYRRGGGARV